MKGDFMNETKTETKITAEEFDRRFDAGEDMTPYLDLRSATRPGLELQRDELELPAFLWSRLEERARLLSMSRDQLVRAWLLEKLNREP
jgi:hypothetical protein